MKSLKLGKGLDLPLEVVTQKLAWLGVTGSGKTYGATKLAEELWHAGAQFVALDPVGVWYGLRLDADGQSPGIPVPVFGGLHGDLPLDPSAGALVADLIADRRISAILDVSQFESDTQKARFASDFADRLFFRWKASASAVHVFLEECQEFVPQNPQRGEEKMLHHFHRLQKLGRNFGIGTSLISQRPQEVNKKALNQAQTVFAFRMTGSQERDAVEKWMGDKGLEQDLAGDLPKIDTGHCHVWSPSWLKVSKVVRILPKHTFNASATPEVGVAASSRELAPIDIVKIRDDMATVVERQKADDPAELKKTVANLNRELAQLKNRPDTAPPAAPALTEQDRALLEVLIQHLTSDVTFLETYNSQSLKEFKATLDNVLAHRLELNAMVVQETAKKLAELFERAEIKTLMHKLGSLSVAPLLPRQAPPSNSAATRVARAAAQIGAKPTRGPAEGLDGAQQKILDTVLMLKARGIEANRVSVAKWMGIHPNGGRYGSNLGFLRANGYLDGFTLTVEGETAANGMDTGLEALRQMLDGACRAIVDVLDNDKRTRFTRETLAAVLGIHPNGGRYGSNLGLLRAMGVIPERSEIFLTEAVYR